METKCYTNENGELNLRIVRQHAITITLRVTQKELQEIDAAIQAHKPELWTPEVGDRVMITKIESWGSLMLLGDTGTIVDTFSDGSGNSWIIKSDVDGEAWAHEKSDMKPV